MGTMYRDNVGLGKMYRDNVWRQCRTRDNVDYVQCMETM